MARGAFQRVAAILLASTSIASCSGSSPSGPAAPAPSTPQTPVAVRAAIDITSISVVGRRAADVPPLSDPVAILYSLTGVIVDQATGMGIAGARVDALNGINAGKAATTDQSGAYSLAGLTADGFRMRASASGFDPGEQNVTV